MAHNKPVALKLALVLQCLLSILPFIEMTKVAIVTGANKGIGFGTVRGLCKRFDGDVFLTSRNVERGLKAVEDLRKEGLNPKYHQLDITDRRSLETFRDFLQANYSDGIDVFINNAGISFGNNAPESRAEQARLTLEGNYFSFVLSSEILFPLLKPGARVVNVASSYGQLNNIPSEDIRRRLRDPALTLEELNALMHQYVNDVKAGNDTRTWGYSAYKVSKVGVIALTMIQQRNLQDRGVIVNAVHPGYVSTDMTNHHGYLSIDEGSVASLYAALDVSQSYSYQYINPDRTLITWN